MQVMAVIPWLDIFLLLLFVGLVALGFWQGLLREVWFLLALYLAAVLASLYGDYAAALIGARVQGIGTGGSSNTVTSALGFFVVFVLAVLVLFTILALLFGQLKLRASLLWLDKVGGIVLGMLTAFLLTSVIAYIVYALLGEPGPLREYAFITILRSQRSTSPTLRAFLSARPLVVAMISPWLPRGLPAFLR